MKSVLKTLAIGFFAVLPVLIVYLLIGQLFDMLLALTAPLNDLLPATGIVLHLSKPLRAAIWLVALLLLVGIAAQTGTGRKVGDWVERSLLNRLPLYPMLRSLAQGLSADEELAKLRPALVTTWPNLRTFAFVVEEHANGDCTIFMPIAPTPNVGYVSIVGREHLQMLDVPARKALGAVLGWGDGAAALLAANPESVPKRSHGP